MESCYIQVHMDGTVERGCTLDKTKMDPNWCDELEDCDHCTSDGCNNENFYFGYCLQCNSLNDGRNCEKPIFGSNEFYLQCTPMRFEEVDQLDEAYNKNGTDDDDFFYEPYPFSKRGCYSLQQGKN